MNEAVEHASAAGVLTCTSLMVAAPAAADAVARAKQLPGLRVGLHIVLTNGIAVLPPSQIPDLVDAGGRFDDNMAKAGVKFFFLPHVRRQLAAEIRAQFEAFRATGLPLDHVNAHRHFHLHPTLGNLIVAIGRDYGLKAMRVPLEPMAAVQPAARAEGLAVSAPFYTPWIKLLARRLTQAGVAVNDHVLGLTWSGGMTEARVTRLIENLPAGVTELYCHPATRRTPRLEGEMPDYAHVAEYEALISPGVQSLIHQRGIDLIAYSDLTAPLAAPLAAAGTA